MFIDIFNTDKKYKIIYADPPWKYDDTLGNNPKYGGITYPTMTPDELAHIPISNITDKDCVLLMWVTMPKLNDCFSIIKSWGFNYKTCAFCWVKQNPNGSGIYSGLGHYTNSNSELCLLATKGNPKRIAKDVKQIIIAPRGGHSQKPKETYERIERLFGDIPRIELFARNTYDGWDCWGNEVTKYDENTQNKSLW